MKIKTLFLIYIALLVSLLGLACTGQQNPREAKASLSSSRSFDYVSMIPEETNVVFYANFRELQDSPFGHDVRAHLETKIQHEDEDYLEFVEATGLDLRRDVQEFWVGARASKVGDGRSDIGGAIVRGNFNEDRIVEFVKHKSERRPHDERYEDIDLYFFEGKKSNEVGLGFLDSGTMIVGSPAWLRQVVELSENRGRSIADNRHMSDHIRRIPQKPQLWGVFNVQELTDMWADQLRSGGSGFAGTESIENMESMVVYAHVGRQAELYLEGNFGTREQAELLAETLVGLKAMAKLMVSDDREAIDMLNEIKVKSDGEILTLSAQVGPDFFEKLERKREKFKSRRFDFM